MTDLVVHNIDKEIARALKARAVKLGISVEAEHRRILEEALLRPAKRPLAEVLKTIPSVGKDSDFERIQDEGFSGS